MAVLTTVILTQALGSVVGSALSASKRKKANALLDAYAKKEISYNALINQLSNDLNLNRDQRVNLEGAIAKSQRGVHRDKLERARDENKSREISIASDIKNTETRRDTDRAIAEKAASEIQNPTSIIEHL